MDLGASVAFVAEPAAPGAMRRPPRDPARRFLDRGELGAIAASGLALGAATLGGYLLLSSLLGTAVASTAAMATWLAGHAGVAWALRARPGLPPAANPTFPGWALAALAAGVVLAASPAGGGLGLRPLPAAGWAVVAAGVGVAVALAVLGRQLTRAQTAL
jgi:P-type Ca2+ transporter type 2C